MRLAAQDILQAATLQLHYHPSIRPNTADISLLIPLILSHFPISTCPITD